MIIRFWSDLLKKSHVVDVWVYWINNKMHHWRLQFHCRQRSFISDKSKGCVDLNNSGASCSQLQRFSSARAEVRRRVRRRESSTPSSSPRPWMAGLLHSGVHSSLSQKLNIFPGRQVFHLIHILITKLSTEKESFCMFDWHYLSWVAWDERRQAVRITRDD